MIPQIGALILALSFLVVIAVLSYDVLPGHRLEWVASHTHPFKIELRRALWPPFYSAEWFRPRISATISNAGRLLEKTTFTLEVRPYDGPISAVSSLKDGWVDTAHVDIEGPWKPGEKRRIKATVRSRSLPREGTYVLRALIKRWVPPGTPLEEASQALKGADIDERKKRVIVDFITKDLTQKGIDPHKAQPGGYRAEQILEATIVEYFRVEPLTNLVAYSGGLVALATVAVGLVAWLWRLGK